MTECWLLRDALIVSYFVICNPLDMIRLCLLRFCPCGTGLPPCCGAAQAPPLLVVPPLPYYTSVLVSPPVNEFPEARVPRLQRGPVCDHWHTQCIAALTSRGFPSAARLTGLPSWPSYGATVMSDVRLKQVPSPFAPPELSRPQISEIKATVAVLLHKRVAALR